jgi:transcriptional regulator with XRE-family HTH domain
LDWRETIVSVANWWYNGSADERTRKEGGMTEEPRKYTLGQWLDERIRRKGAVSIRAAAREIGISSPALTDLLRDQHGRNGPTTAVLEAVARWADVRTAYLYDMLDRGAGRDLPLEAEIAAFLGDYPQIREDVRTLIEARNRGEITNDDIRVVFDFASLKAESIRRAG